MDSCSPTVTIHQAGMAVCLEAGTDPVQVAEGPCSLSFVGLDQEASVLLDGEITSLLRSGRSDEGFLSLDLTNRVGFHRVTIRQGAKRFDFDFETSTAKATWLDIKAMANAVASHVFSFRRQFLYSTASGSRGVVWLPEVEFAWIRDRLREIDSLVAQIDRSPAQESRHRLRTSNQALKVSVAQSLRFLRERPALLEQATGGPIVVDGTSYWPSALRVRRIEKEPARVEHAQISTFLDSLARSLERLRLDVPATVRVELGQLRDQVARVRSRSVIVRHAKPGAAGNWSPIPTAVQRSDARYRRLRALHTEYLHEIHAGGPTSDAVRLNVRDAWEIYQSFAAQMIGKSLGLNFVEHRKDLRARSSTGVSMRSVEWELYYDLHPPAEVAVSWRDASDRPADERPDVLLRHLPTGEIVLVDVKFRVNPDKRSARGEDLFEMQGYMNSFRVCRGAIVFPGTEPGARAVEAEGVRLVEIPLRPEFFDGASADAALSQLKSDLHKLRCPPGVST